MTIDGDEEIRRSAKAMIERYGANAVSKANDRLRDVIPQRDQEMISHWRAVIRVLSKMQP